MIEWLYRFLARLSRFVGLWLMRVTAAIVATGYFILLPRQRSHSVHFYRALFPERSAWHAFRCAWRQYQDFARLYGERLELERRPDVRIESDSERKLMETRAAGRGAILVADLATGVARPGAEPLFAADPEGSGHGVPGARSLEREVPLEGEVLDPDGRDDSDRRLSEALVQALQYGLYDLPRIEQLILSHVAGDFFTIEQDEQT